jgi:hypothetical protein
MASFETRVTEIRADPRGGFSVMLKPHFLERDVAYQKVWLEPHFDNHCASIAEDSIEVRTEHAPPVYVGQIVTVYAVEPELPPFEVAASRPACSFGRPLQHPSMQ